jgi:hypothetical protein
MNGHPDFVVGLDATLTHTEGVTRRTVVEAPEWQPGTTLPAPPASVDAIAAADTWGWGTLPDPTAGVAQLPEWPPRGRVKGVQHDFRYTVNVTASILDGKSMAEVWVGTGSGISRSPDVKVASQSVFWMVLHQFPETAMAEMTAKAGDLPGLNLEVLTNDGKNYYPGVIDVENRSPAWKAGIVNCDMILAVGGEPAWNRTGVDVRRMIAGPPESTMALTLWRNGSQVNVEARRVAVAAEADSGAVAPPPVSAADASKPRPQARLDIPRTSVSLDKMWAIVGALAIVGLVAAIFGSQK